ncbi:hypothetical protein [Vitiosangium sp. GDMCC 1.1324]|uniref:hypothetical protein n=1 Tax=Vitiosangium sp. (strain GDMCC 1.1324) TaxID=2138576 RepID=UPI000D3C5EBC|nr:hypothetical protein [Vitiosangium sp. GDMCC 1.1324]PTL79898.1 hypothetical protein DAT35_31185 [Vitiosangium sp. GDMCC 1.1324]
MRFNLRHIVPVALLSLVGCGVETPASEAQPAAVEEVGQVQSMLQASDCQGCLAGTENTRFVSGFTREQVTSDIAHYSIRLQVGPDAAHDIIVLHRVVKEQIPWWPARAPESVLMVHGDAWDFRGAFMASTLTAQVQADHSIAVYLAQQGVDVWGIDLRWTQVPAETQDFTFMKNWNLGTHAKDVGTSLTVARAVRALTGSGAGKMNLLGWSRGAQVAYAYMSAETDLPPGLRSVSGFIPVDMVMHFGPEAEQQRQWACVRATVGDMLLKSGRYEGNLSGSGAGVLIMQVGQAAIYWPNTQAQLPGMELPPMTYSQLGVTVGAATYMFLSNEQAGIYPAVPGYHFAAGKFDPNNALTGLQQVTDRQFFDFLSSAHPYQSFTEQVEGDQLLCGQKDLPYDDNLSEVKVPVLYVGAAGGYGSYGEYSAKKLLGSKDVTILRVQKFQEAFRAADYGHADLFLGANAKTDVWAPIYQWMKKH